MGAEIALRNFGVGTILSNFGDTIVAKIHLNQGNWVIFGRVFIVNFDGDLQSATVHLVTDANIDIDTVVHKLEGRETVCYTMHGMLTVQDKETVTLNCNSYDGWAHEPSVVAIKVDRISIV